MLGRFGVLLCLFSGSVTFAGAPQGEFVESAPGKAVLRLAPTADGLHGELSERGSFPVLTYEFTKRDGAWWCAGPLENSSFTLSSTDDWKTVELVSGIGIGTKRAVTLKRQRFARATSGQAQQAVYGQEQRPPSADAATIRKVWGLDGPLAPVPDDTWVAGRRFGYRATLATVNGKPVFTVRGEGLTPETKGLTCSLVSARPGADMVCIGM